MFGRQTTLLAIFLTARVVLAADPTVDLLGEAIALSSAELAEHTCSKPTLSGESPAATNRAAVPTGGFTVDTTRRYEVLDLYHCVYMASWDFADRMGWVGDIAGCDAGTVSQDFHDDTLRRINFYRALTGLNTNIFFNPVKNAKCQQAALIMGRNRGLSHYPITEHPEWSCLSTDGNEAAGKSNLSISSGTFRTGPRAVDGQIEDLGTSNKPVGHRRWLLYSRAVEMGNGGVPGGGEFSSSGAIWVVGDFGPFPPTPEWISWPNPGYSPVQLVPARWSFSLPGAPLGAFDSASVSMTQGGSPVNLQVVHPAPDSPARNIGDPTIVWEPVGVPAFPWEGDTAYTITVSGISGTETNSYTYDVVVFDPYTLDQEAVINGPDLPLPDIPQEYTFAPVAGAQNYDLRIRKFEASELYEGGEPDPVPHISDGTSPDYELIQNTVVRTGSAAFHLAFPGFQDQVMGIDRVLRPGPDSELSFAYLRRYSSVFNTISAQISSDDGETWTDVWEQTGICSGTCSSDNWDQSWNPVSVPLGAFAGRPLHMRFVFAPNGNIYSGTSMNYGVFLDDIRITDSMLLTGTQTRMLGGDSASFTLTPEEGVTYAMDIRPQLACYQFGYGPVLSVTGKVRLTPTINWPAPANMVYGTPLGADRLNATADTPGTFVYDPPVGSIPHAGSSQPLAVSFLPDNQQDWRPVTATVYVDVLPALLTITADNKSRAFGQNNPELTWTVTGLVAGDTAAVLTGSPALSCQADTISPVAGSPYPIRIFPGSLEALDYTFTFLDGKLAIFRGTPTITWNDPPPIIYETPLSQTQLSASADTGGDFTFNPDFGAVLDAGDHILTADFTPDDPANWESVTGITADLSVEPAPQSINFANPGTKAYHDEFVLSADGGNSGKPVTFEVTAGPAVIDPGHTLTFTGLGEVTVIASQTGTGNYLPAEDVSRTFTVVPSLRIDVLLPGRETRKLLIGWSGLATDGFDVGLDTAAAACPNDGSGCAVLVDPAAATPAQQALTRDFRTAAETLRWLLYVDPGGNGTTADLAWDVDLAEGSRALYLQPLAVDNATESESAVQAIPGCRPFGEPIDMKAETAAAVDKPTVFEIAHAPLSSQSLACVEGWNLLGTGVMTVQSLAELLAGHTRLLRGQGSAWQVGGPLAHELKPEASPNPEHAIWLRCANSAEAIQVIGIASDALIRLQPGWNHLSPAAACPAYQNPRIADPIWFWNAAKGAWCAVPAGGTLSPGKGYSLFLQGQDSAIMDTGAQ